MRPRAPNDLLVRVAELARGAGVGVVATLVDLAVLALLVEAGGLAPVTANVPALLAGAAVQFVGCRHVVFGGHRGSLRRQLAGFVATEAATLALNALLFHALVTLTPVPYAAARPLGTFLVFVGFSFPLWRRVFAPETANARRGGSATGVPRM